MLTRKNYLATFGLLLLVLTFSAPAVQAGKPNEFDTIANHLKSKYKAKKVNIPFMWLARAAVKVVRPAGVKSFNVTLFDGLKFLRESLDLEMQTAMRNSFGPEWSPIFHVRSRDGEQAYMYMREDGKDVKIALVTIDKEEAALIRATFSPEKLAAFINNPRIFGISLNDDDQKTNKQTAKPNEDAKPDTDKH